MQGNEMLAIRVSLGLTQAKLAKELGVSRVFVGMMERDEKPISDRTALALRNLRAASHEQVYQHDYSVIPADRVGGFNVVFTHAGWRGMFGNRQVVLYGHFRQERHARRWAKALEESANPRHQRHLHRIVKALVAEAEAREAGRP